MAKTRPDPRPSLNLNLILSLQGRPTGRSGKGRPCPAQSLDDLTIGASRSPK